MTIIPWDPWKELVRVREQTDRIWDEFLATITGDFEGRVAFIPSADIVEVPNEYRLVLAVPGFLEEDIEIIVHDRGLVVRGERLPLYDSDSSKPLISEVRYGIFERHFQLSETIDTGSLRAQYDSGMLTILVRKSNDLKAVHGEGADRE